MKTHALDLMTLVESLGQQSALLNTPLLDTWPGFAGACRGWVEVREGTIASCVLEGVNGERMEGEHALSLLRSVKEWQVTFTQGTISSVLLPPLILQVLTALVTFFVVRDLNTAIERADRAEEIVALKNEVITLTRTHAQGKQQLEEGIRQIAEVHAQVANGNLSARVSLTSSNVLYAVAVPLNNLLSRAQQWKKERDALAQEVRVLQVRLDQIPPSHRSLLL